MKKLFLLQMLFSAYLIFTSCKSELVKQDKIQTKTGKDTVLVKQDTSSLNKDSVVVSDDFIKIDIGKDTTIYEGDTLKLDAGEGFDSYSWNGGESNQRVFIVAKAGKYWVEVTKDDKYGMDTISVDVQKKGNCNSTKRVDVYLGNLDIPCSYTYTESNGLDSWSFDIRSPKQDIVLENEIEAIEEYDTLFSLPIKYKSYSKRLKIVRNNKEIGVIFFEKLSELFFRNTAGVFLMKEKSYYLEVLHASYAENKHKEVVNILSTFKRKHKNY